MNLLPLTGDSRQTMAIILLAVLALGAAGLGYMIYCRRQEEKEAARRAAQEADEDAEQNAETQDGGDAE